jgi:hypothetical protein
VNIEHLTNDQLSDLHSLLEESYDYGSDTSWVLDLMADVLTVLQKRFLAGASKPRARVVNKVPILTMREPLKQHGEEFYDKTSRNIVHASYNRGIRYVHDGLYEDCLECGAW